eukprot:6018119-Lingulodinium_polyedra.AAC.1
MDEAWPTRRNAVPHSMRQGVVQDVWMDSSQGVDSGHGANAHRLPEYRLVFLTTFVICRGVRTCS